MPIWGATQLEIGGKHVMVADTIHRGSVKGSPCTPISA